MHDVVGVAKCNTFEQHLQVALDLCGVNGLWAWHTTSARSDCINSKASTKPAPCGNAAFSCTT